MLTEQEETFLKYWNKYRTTEQKSFKQYLKGLSRGFAISVAIIVLVATGWYKRANMEANSKLSFTVLAIALLGIAVFMAWLYQNYRWEEREQQYLELLEKKKRLANKADSKEDILN
jgi:hypothetical protein